jgi:serine/threonine protein kinase
MPALDAMAALNRRGGFICGVNPDMIRVRLDASGSEHLVMTTAGIKSVQDVLATMREQELRGQEASEQELPYIAPEVLMGGAPNVRADVFTIGVLAYQMVTGTMPFRAPSLPELLGQMLQVRPPSPAALNASVPAAAGAAILRAIDGVAASRFESAGQFAAAF